MRPMSKTCALVLSLCSLGSLISAIGVDAQNPTTARKPNPQGADQAPPPQYEDVRYGPYRRNLLDLWIPESDAPTPLIIHIHGGGFVGGDKSKVRRTPTVAQALDRGIAFASINYRFRFPDTGDTSDPERAAIQNILRDAARSVQFLRLNCERFNLDPECFACYGGSAGAGTSLWLAFHEDLADPVNSDPVLRQSSRLSAAGMLNGQFSYDLEQWDKAFAAVGGSLVKTHGRNGVLPLHHFYGLDASEYRGEAGKRVRADVDMRGLISADDPPVFLQCTTPERKPTTRGIYNHHPLHAQLIEKRCRECGVDVVCVLPAVRQVDKDRLKSDPEMMVAFFEEQFAKTRKKSSPLPAATPSDVGFDGERLQEVHEVMEGFVRDHAIAGGVVAIARDGKLVMMDAVGFQDVEAKIPMSTDSIFRIYSMTKPIASAAAMILVDRGIVKLDDPVAKYIPCFAEARVFSGKEDGKIVTEPLRRAVTVRDLLRHTSGLTYGFFGNSAVDQLYRQANVLADDDDCQSLCEKVAKIPLMNQPGDRFQYGVSVDVLGRVIEVASGMNLDDFLRSEIFEPLRMEDTGFFVPESDVFRMTVNYAPNSDGELEIADHPSESRFTENPKMLSGGGGLVSTAGDYLRFAQMIANGGILDGKRILKPETVQSMTKDQLPTRAFPAGVGMPMPGVGFGLGFSVVVNREDYPHPVEGEYGWDGMASTHYFASPSKGFVVVALTQRYPFSSQVEDAIKPIIYSAVLDHGPGSDEHQTERSPDENSSATEGELGAIGN